MSYLPATPTMIQKGAVRNTGSLCSAVMSAQVTWLAAKIPPVVLIMVRFVATLTHKHLFFFSTWWWWGASLRGVRWLTQGITFPFPSEPCGVSVDTSRPCHCAALQPWVNQTHEWERGRRKKKKTEATRKERDVWPSVCRFLLRKMNGPCRSWLGGKTEQPL